MKDKRRRQMPNLVPVQQQQQKKTNNKGKGGKTNGILARGGAIRDEKSSFLLSVQTETSPVHSQSQPKDKNRPKYALTHTLSHTHVCNSGHSHPLWHYLFVLSKKTFLNRLFLLVFFCRKGTTQIYLVGLWRHWNIQQCSACRLEREPCMT